MCGNVVFSMREVFFFLTDFIFDQKLSQEV
jgi:hypothetical protein